MAFCQMQRPLALKESPMASFKLVDPSTTTSRPPYNFKTTFFDEAEILVNPQLVASSPNHTQSWSQPQVLQPSQPRIKKQNPQAIWDVPTLPLAAIFRPTEEEFVDPMKYIASISAEAQKYGICKVIPPSDKFLKGKKMMDFVEAKSFLFPTKVQNIHQLQTRNGPCSVFMEELETFLEKRKTPLRSNPVLDGHELDLYKLYKEVVSRGGAEQVTMNKQWREIATEMRISPDFPKAGRSLSAVYEKYLAAYDHSHSSKLKPEANFHFASAKGKSQVDKAKSKAKKQKQESSSESDDFGYYDGRMYTLNQFKKMADTFKDRFFPGDGPTSDQIEKMYWKLVESSEESVKVHYGSDVDVGTYGSGFPNTPEDLEHASGWNLNIFATWPGSILQFLNEQISGVVRPMMYIGMLFSSFCWHTEDNYLYSINYLHHGAPKTWYGIPAYAAERFEAVMKKTVPELFEQNPNLLFCLVTQLSPRILVKHGVPVYTALQQPGEFMLTFPKGYHAGFSHGFNCAESCNFALADWFDWGKECLERYRNYGRSSVLSIEKLLCTAANAPVGPAYIPKLKSLLEEMRGRELYLREKVLIKDGTWKTAHFDTYAGEQGFLPECTLCKYDCYLSAVVCPCSPDQIFCLRHAENTCACEPQRKVFLFRYHQKELDDLVSNVGVDLENIQSICDSKRSVTVTVGAGHRPTKHKVSTIYPRLKGVGKPAVRRLARRAGLRKVQGVKYSELHPLLNDQQRIIETITESRAHHGKTEYLIKWQGKQEGTWMTAEDLGLSSLVDAFKNRFKKKEDIQPSKTRVSDRIKTRRMGRAVN